MDPARLSSTSDFGAFIVPVCTSPSTHSGSDHSKDILNAMKKVQPLYYNGLLDESNESYIKKPGVREHLIKQGLMTRDGTIVPTKEELVQTNKVRKFLEEQKGAIRRIKKKEEARLNRIQQLARFYEYTNYGKGQRGSNQKDNMPLSMSTSKESRQRPRSVKRNATADTFHLYSTHDSGRPGSKDKNGTKKTIEKSPYLFKFSVDSSEFRKMSASLKSALESRGSGNGILMKGSPFPKYRPCSVAILKLQSAMAKAEQPEKIKTPPQLPKLPATKREFPIKSNTFRAKDLLSICENITDSRKYKPKETKLPKLASNKPLTVTSPSESSLEPVITPPPLPPPTNTVTSRGGPQSVKYWDRKLNRIKRNRRKVFNLNAGSKRDRSKSSKYSSKRISQGIKPRRVDKAKSREEEEAKDSTQKKPGDVEADDESGTAPTKEDVVRRDADSPKDKSTKEIGTMVSSLEEKETGEAMVGSEGKDAALDVAIQTEVNTSFLSDDDRKDLFGLLQELAFIPPKCLDSVMEMIIEELMRPDVSYGRMLKQIQACTAINEDVFEKILEENSDIPQVKLPSTPIIATLAKHVIDDFVFSQNMTSGSMTNKDANIKKSSDFSSYTIEDGAHSLHTAISFQEGVDVVKSESESDTTTIASIKSSPLYRPPSSTLCHFNKIPGEIYHMYQRRDGVSYFSMLSPKEKGISSHTSFLGSYRENGDGTMTLIASPSTLTKDSSETESDQSQYDQSSSSECPSCIVERVPGFVYYKYRKKDGNSFLTTVSPKAWGPSCPHRFVRAYRETKLGALVPTKTESTACLLASSKQELVEKEIRPPTPVSPLLKQSKSCPDTFAMMSSCDGGVSRSQRTQSSIECSFATVAGKVYHLYKRRDGSIFLSTLPPTTGDNLVQDKFLASYISSDNGNLMTLLEPKPKEDLDIPSVISKDDIMSTCSSDKVPTESTCTVIPASSSRELVETLLEASSTESHDSTKLWIDELITEAHSSLTNSRQDTYNSSEGELFKEVKRLIPKRNSGTSNDSKTSKNKNGNNGKPAKIWKL